MPLRMRGKFSGSASNAPWRASKRAWPVTAMSAARSANSLSTRVTVSTGQVPPRSAKAAIKDTRRLAMRRARSNAAMFASAPRFPSASSQASVSARAASGPARKYSTATAISASRLSVKKGLQPKIPLSNAPVPGAASRSFAAAPIARSVAAACSRQRSAPTRARSPRPGRGAQRHDLAIIVGIGEMSYPYYSSKVVWRSRQCEALSE